MTNVPASWIAVRDPEGVISVRHPPDWKASSSGVLTLASPNVSALMTFLPISDDSANQAHASLWIEEHFDTSKAVTERRPIQTRTWRGFSQHFKASPEEWQECMVAVASQPPMCVILIATDSPPLYSTHEPVFHSILETLTLNPNNGGVSVTKAVSEPEPELPRHTHGVFGLFANRHHRNLVKEQLAKYPARKDADPRKAADHNPLVLEDCYVCRGLGRVATGSGLPKCQVCGGTGAGTKVVKLFTNQAPIEVVTAEPNGWVTCPSCGKRFSAKDKAAFTGLRHGKCGQRLKVIGHQDPPQPTSEARGT